MYYLPTILHEIKTRVADLEPPMYSGISEEIGVTMICLTAVLFAASIRLAYVASGGFIIPGFRRPRLGSASS